MISVGEYTVARVLAKVTSKPEDASSVARQVNIALHTATRADCLLIRSLLVNEQSAP